MEIAGGLCGSALLCGRSFVEKRVCYSLVFVLFVTTHNPQTAPKSLPYAFGFCAVRNYYMYTIPVFYHGQHTPKNKHQNKSNYQNSQFESIPDTFYFVIITMTTVGYGDKAPTQFWGQTFTIVTAVIGIFFIAFPVSIFR